MRTGSQRNLNRKSVRPMYRWRRTVTHAGFTLLELMISLSILSLVTLIIGSGFRLGLTAWERGESEIVETQRLRALSSLISQGLKSAYPYKTEIEDDEVVLFEGDKNSVLFVTTAVDPYDGGFKWIRYSYDEGTLIYNEGILPDKDFMDKTARDEEMLDSMMREVKFEYFSSEEGDWQETWEFGESLPSSVRVSIEYYPPIVASLPMAVQEEKKEVALR